MLRLWPLVIAASLACLAWGSWWMLPDDYEGVAQDVVASNLWANNILMSIKSSDYWAVKNEFKPLMHTWYLGIVVQFYIAFAALLIIAKKLIKSKKDIIIHIVGVCFIISLVLFLLPNYGMTAKFYYLPFRVFEFCAGCWVALWLKNHSVKWIEGKSSGWTIVGYVCVLALLFWNGEQIPANVKLLLTVLLTCLLLVCLPYVGAKVDAVVSNKWVALIGRCSFSIYIWHQIVFAFCRYSFTSEFTVGVFTLLLLITAALSVLSYKFVEQGVTNAMATPKGKKRVMIGTGVGTAVCLGISMLLYLQAGVIRDVPELDTYKGKAFRGMHIAYNENARRFDKDFESEDKLHWVVVGDSYGRDWTNVLAEAGISDEVEVRYIYENDSKKESSIERLRKADMIFFTTSIIPDDRRLNNFLGVLNGNGISTDHLRVVGSKLYGVCNGQIYVHHKDAGYFDATVEIGEEYFTKNEEFKAQWGERYIDMVTPVSAGCNRVRVFSDDHKFISQDCEHFTQGGAKYYARLLKPIILKQIEWCNQIK